MTHKNARRIRLVECLLIILAAFVFVLTHVTHAGDEPVQLVTDWSHRHLVFSAPKTLMDQFRLGSSERYAQQWVRRYAERKRAKDYWRWHHAEEPSLQGDWSVYIGNVGTAGAGKYPAKYSFDVTSANCGTAAQPDFVVWNTNLAGSAVAVAARDTGTFSAAAGPGSTITITNPNTGRTLVMTAAAANAHTPPNNSGKGTFNAVGSAANNATNLAAAIRLANNGNFVGVNAPAAGVVGSTVTITATAAGTPGNNITLTAQAAANFTPTFGNFVDGASGVPSILAYDNLYSSCTGTVPSSYWAYNTGGRILNSVALSLDGSQVAFVQTVAGVAHLVLLKWKAGSGTAINPTALVSQASGAAYRACTAPCTYSIAFGNGLNDTNSSPFYDFTPGADTIFVGDTPATPGTTHAFLHKFTGMFNGTPAEVTTGGWPAQLGTEAATSPVYDVTNNQVYVADANNNINPPDGGFLYRVDGTAGTVVTSGRLARGVGFAEGPVVDSGNGTVYVYTSDYGNLGCTGVQGTGTTNNVAQMAGGFLSGATAVTTAQISAANTCSTTFHDYAGDFDNAYYSGLAGNLYVCGNIGSNPTLYQVAVSKTGALGAVTTGPQIATSSAAAPVQCSPVTGFYNSTTAKDYIFFSRTGSSTATNCPSAGGCLMSFDVTSGAAINAGTTPHATTAVSGGTSGVIIDNSSAIPGASQVYFSPLASGSCATAASKGIGGCAIQASQSGLN